MRLKLVTDFNLSPHDFKDVDKYNKIDILLTKCYHTIAFSSSTQDNYLIIKNQKPSCERIIIFKMTFFDKHDYLIADSVNNTDEFIKDIWAIILGHHSFSEKSANKLQLLKFNENNDYIARYIKKTKEKLEEC